MIGYVIFVFQGWSGMIFSAITIFCGVRLGMSFERNKQVERERKKVAQ